MTFRLSDREFNGTEAIAYRPVITCISLGKASKMIVVPTYNHSIVQYKRRTRLAMIIIGILHHSILETRGFALS
jgi:hypothetical protein